MKNFIKLFGNLNQDRRSKVPLLIIALAAVIVFSMAGCKHDGGGGGGNDGSLNGTWTRDISGVTVSFTVSGSDYTSKVSDVYADKGTISYNGSTITLTETHGWSGSFWVTVPSYPYTAYYTLSGNTLTVSGSSDVLYNLFNGVWTRS